MTDSFSQKTPSNLSATVGSGGTHRFADLSVALIKFCIQDGDAASQEISERLTAMQAIVNEAKALVANADNANDTDAISDKLDNIGSEIMDTVISLQFFDRISQRMEHAIESVEVINDAASEKAKTLEQRFTMDDERILYDALLEGLTVDEALERASQKLTDTIDCHGSDIELF